MHGLVGIITRCDTADGLLTVLTFQLEKAPPIPLHRVYKADPPHKKRTANRPG